MSHLQEDQGKNPKGQPALQNAKLDHGLDMKDLAVSGNHGLEEEPALSNAELGLRLDMRDRTDPGKNIRDPVGIEEAGQDADPG